MTARRLLFLAFCLIVIVEIYFFAPESNKEIVLGDIKWECSGGACSVAFFIENQTSLELSARLAVRAYSLKKIGEKMLIDGFTVNELQTEKIISLNLGPYETRTANEALVIPPHNRVDVVEVNILAIRQSRSPR